MTASKSFWPNDDAPALISWLKMNNVSEITALLAVHCLRVLRDTTNMRCNGHIYGHSFDIAISNNIVTIYPASSYTGKHSTLTSSTILAIN